MSSKIPWFLVSGFGAHIKSSPTKLIVLQKDGSKEYSIDRLKHLLIVGGHTLHTSTVNHLLRQGIYISFFEADGTPVGILRPYGDDAQSLLRPFRWMLTDTSMQLCFQKVQSNRVFSFFKNSKTQLKTRCSMKESFRLSKTHSTNWSI